MFTTFRKIYTVLTIALLFCAVTPALAQTSQITSNTSTNWAGYVASGSTYTGVGSSWTIPTPTQSTSTPTTADATWVGIGGQTSQDLIQAGTQAIVENGTVTYQAWYELLPQSQQVIPLNVHDGDSVTVSLQETSSNNWQISFVDHTTGQQYQTSVTYESTHSSAEWIEEMPVLESSRGIDSFLPLDNFGTVQFTNGYTDAGGSQETLATAGAQAVTMVTSQTQALATASVLGGDGASFTISRSPVSAQNGAPSENASHQEKGFRGFTRGRRQQMGWSARQFSVRFTNFAGGISFQYTRW